MKESMLVELTVNLKSVTFATCQTNFNLWFFPCGQLHTSHNAAHAIYPKTSFFAFFDHPILLHKLHSVQFHGEPFCDCLADRNKTNCPVSPVERVRLKACSITSSVGRSGEIMQ